LEIRHQPTTHKTAVSLTVVTTGVTQGRGYGEEFEVGILTGLLGLAGILAVLVLVGVVGRVTQNEVFPIDELG
jgi:uncharacterized membrane protein